MNQEVKLPSDPATRFREIYAALNSSRSFWGGSLPLRFASISAIACPGSAEQVAADIRRTADEIKEHSGWFGELNSPLRFIVSTMLLLSGDKAVNFLSEVERVRTIFRKVKLRRGAIYELMAILLLRQKAELQAIPDNAIDRFKAIYEQMKEYHWWLTGPDDFPACAMLVGQEGTPENICYRIEKIYQALSSRKFTKGDPLQTAANILFLTHLDSEEIAIRYFNLAQEFKSAGVRIWQSDYDELAILSFLDHTAQRIVGNVLSNREMMKELKPRPDPSMTFNLAASITFVHLVQLDKDANRLTDLKALMDMQQVINAQQAAAATAAATAATAAST